MESEPIDIISKKKKQVKNNLREYDNLSLEEQLKKFDEEIKDLIIDIKNEDIDYILDYTSSLFFKFCIYLLNSTKEKKENIQNKLSQLYHKLKNLYFFK